MHPLPLKIDIGYQTVRVVKADLLEAQGVYLADRSEIQIKDSLEPREVVNTILHECLHAICYVYGLKNEFKDDDHEERVVNALGNGLTEMFIRNSKILDCIRNSL